MTLRYQLSFAVIFRKAMCSFLAFTLALSLAVPPSIAQALPNLPAPGQAVWLTPDFNPPLLKGMIVHPENPLLFDFIVDRGQDKLGNQELKLETEKLIKYFLASMTIPDKDAWVNLSPYEQDRIIPDALGSTEMGRQMLEQDYILKQLSSSLTNPETELGRQYWNEVRRRAQIQFGTTDLPLDTVSKVWIVPDGATVVERGGFVYITESKLKVMLEQDYVAMSNQKDMAESLTPDKDVALENRGESSSVNREALHVSRETNDEKISHEQTVSKLTTEVFRELILPKLVNEVNTGKNFAPTRQVYQGVVLATWYKEALKGSLLVKIYADRSKTEGVETDDKDIKRKVYEQYLEAFKKGVYNLIKEDQEPNGEIIPRKYFSGGQTFVDVALTRQPASSADLSRPVENGNDLATVKLAEPGGEAGAVQQAAVVEQAALARTAVATIPGQQTQQKFQYFHEMNDFFIRSKGKFESGWFIGFDLDKGTAAHLKDGEEKLNSDIGILNELIIKKLASFDGLFFGSKRTSDIAVEDNTGSFNFEEGVVFISQNIPQDELVFLLKGILAEFKEKTGKSATFATLPAAEIEAATLKGDGLKSDESLDLYKLTKDKSVWHLSTVQNVLNRLLRKGKGPEDAIYDENYGNKVVNYADWKGRLLEPLFSPGSTPAAGETAIKGVGSGGFSVREYLGMSDAEKQAKRQEFQAKYKGVREEHVLGDDAKLTELVEAAQSLTARYPRGRIVSLGRTPLWFVETARLLENIQGQQSPSGRFIYMGFAGSWWERKEIESKKVIFEKNLSGAKPSDQQITAYRNYLTQLGLDPRSIIEQSDKTIIVEYAQRGEVLRSALSILEEWADELGLKDKLVGKVIVHILEEPESVGQRIDGQALGGFEVAYQEVSARLLLDLVESNGPGVSLGENSHFSKWSEVNPLGKTISPGAKLGQFRIINYLVANGFSSGEIGSLRRHQLVRPLRGLEAQDVLSDFRRDIEFWKKVNQLYEQSFPNEADTEDQSKVDGYIQALRVLKASHKLEKAASGQATGAAAAGQGTSSAGVGAKAVSGDKSMLAQWQEKPQPAIPAGEIYRTELDRKYDFVSVSRVVLGSGGMVTRLVYDRIPKDVTKPDTIDFPGDFLESGLDNIITGFRLDLPFENSQKYVNGQTGGTLTVASKFHPEAGYTYHEIRDVNGAITGQFTDPLMGNTSQDPTAAIMRRYERVKAAIGGSSETDLVGAVEMGRRVMTQDEIDRRIDEIPREYRPRLSFFAPKQDGELRVQFNLSTATVIRPNFENVTGFAIGPWGLNSDALYVAQLDENKQQIFQVFWVSVSPEDSKSQRIKKEYLPLNVLREFNIELDDDLRWKIAQSLVNRSGFDLGLGKIYSETMNDDLTEIITLIGELDTIPYAEVDGWPQERLRLREEITSLRELIWAEKWGRLKDSVSANDVESAQRIVNEARNGPIRAPQGNPVSQIIAAFNAWVAAGGVRSAQDSDLIQLLEQVVSQDNVDGGNEGRGSTGNALKDAGVYDVDAPVEVKPETIERSKSLAGQITEVLEAEIENEKGEPIKTPYKQIFSEDEGVGVMPEGISAFHIREQGQPTIVVFPKSYKDLSPEQQELRLRHELFEAYIKGPLEAALTRETGRTREQFTPDDWKKINRDAHILAAAKYPNIEFYLDQISRMNRGRVRNFIREYLAGRVYHRGLVEEYLTSVDTENHILAQEKFYQALIVRLAELGGNSADALRYEERLEELGRLIIDQSYFMKFLEVYAAMYIVETLDKESLLLLFEDQPEVKRFLDGYLSEDSFESDPIEAMARVRDLFKDVIILLHEKFTSLIADTVVDLGSEIKRDKAKTIEYLQLRIELGNRLLSATDTANEEIYSWLILQKTEVGKLLAQVYGKFSAVFPESLVTNNFLKALSEVDTMLEKPDIDVQLERGLLAEEFHPNAMTEGEYQRADRIYAKLPEQDYAPYLEIQREGRTPAAFKLIDQFRSYASLQSATFFPRNHGDVKDHNALADVVEAVVQEMGLDNAENMVDEIRKKVQPDINGEWPGTQFTAYKLFKLNGEFRDRIRFETQRRRITPNIFDPIYFDYQSKQAAVAIEILTSTRGGAAVNQIKSDFGGAQGELDGAWSKILLNRTLIEEARKDLIATRELRDQKPVGVDNPINFLSEHYIQMIERFVSDYNLRNEFISMVKKLEADSQDITRFFVGESTEQSENPFLGRVLITKYDEFIALYFIEALSGPERAADVESDFRSILSKVVERLKAGASDASKSEPGAGGPDAAQLSEADERQFAADMLWGIQQYAGVHYNQSEGTFGDSRDDRRYRLALGRIRDAGDGVFQQELIKTITDYARSRGRTFSGAQTKVLAGNIRRFLVALKAYDKQNPIPGITINGQSAQTPSAAPGGIDFDPSKLNLQIKRDGRGVPLPLLQQDVESINIKGLYPVIINIIPITSQTLPLLGQLETQSDFVLSKGG